MTPLQPINIIPGIQQYAWGGTTYIAHLLGMNTAVGLPVAEAWFGDHRLAPAHLLDDDHTPLDQWIATNPTEILGAESVEIFGPKMPFLLKILDVRDMLSLQLHPTKEGAIKGYELENEASIPLQASNRNYKDQNHKPELLFALSDFWLLQGFAPLKVIKDRFNAVLPGFQFPADDAWKSIMESIWGLNDKTYQDHLEVISQNLLNQNLSNKNDIFYWIKKALTTYPYQEGSVDRGILVMMMMQVQYLKPGQVGYQAPGVLHAYLEGQNVELMANSDNVLRGGLTPKHIDPVELMVHLDTDISGQCLLEPIPQMDDEIVYISPVRDFVLKHYIVKKLNTKIIQSDTSAILLVRSGELGYGGKILNKGGSIFIPAYATVEVKCNTDGAEYFLACASL